MAHMKPSGNYELGVASRLQDHRDGLSGSWSCCHREGRSHDHKRRSKPSQGKFLDRLMTEANTLAATQESSMQL